MPDTIRRLSVLQGLLADNVLGDISPQDVRDFLVSVMPVGRAATKVVAASNSTTIEIANADYVCDSTADNAEVQAAITALAVTGGTVLLCAGTYNFAAVVTITANKRIKIEGHGAKIVPAANVTAFRINQGAGGSSFGAIIEGVHIDGGSVNGQTGVEFRDTDRSTLRDFRIENCAVGVLFRAETQWVEGGALIDGCITTCTIGWNATVGAIGASSFGESHIRNVHIIDCGTGIGWRQSGNFYRSSLEGVTIWVSNNQTGWIIDGDFKGVYGHVAFESALGAPTAVVGISIGTNASNTLLAHVHMDWTGSYTNKVSDAFDKRLSWYQGMQWYTNSANVEASGVVVLGDTGARFGVTLNAAAGGGMFVGDGSTVKGRYVAEGADLARIYNGLVIYEHADYAAPAANDGVIYVRDNGAGKTQFVVRFSTGAIQVLATEP